LADPLSVDTTLPSDSNRPAARNGTGTVSSRRRHSFSHRPEPNGTHQRGFMPPAGRVRVWSVPDQQVRQTNSEQDTYDETSGRPGCAAVPPRHAVDGCRQTRRPVAFEAGVCPKRLDGRRRGHTVQLPNRRRFGRSLGSSASTPRAGSHAHSARSRSSASRDGRSSRAGCSGFSSIRGGRPVSSTRRRRFGYPPASFSPRFGGKEENATSIRCSQAVPPPEAIVVSPAGRTVDGPKNRRGLHDERSPDGRQFGRRTGVPTTRQFGTSSRPRPAQSR